MSNAQWRFRSYGKDEMRINPIQEEFFTTNIVGGMSNAIVREGIQNALDEWSKVGGTVVNVRLFLSGEKYKVSRKDFDPLFTDLYPHLEEPSAGLRSRPNFNDGMKYLVFEDFNTNGLEGDPEEAEAENKLVPHNFYWFWRNIGISGKSDDKLGRWGLGKTVFPAASRVNSFWGVTIRKSDPERKLLLGQSILMSHKMNNNKESKYGYVPYGYYGEYNDVESNFSSPVTEPSIIKQFTELFKLERQTSTGLSIVVPFVSENITLAKLIYAVFEQYFYPILQGKLKVTLQHEDTVLNLSKESIRDTISQFNFSDLGEDMIGSVRTKESFERLLDLADWACSQPESDLNSLKEIQLSNAPQWRKSLFESLDLQTLSARFDNKERLGFRVPLKYHPKGLEGSVRWYKAFLEKDESLTTPENHFIRNGITITGIRSLISPGVRGLVLIEDEYLVKMIGDAENPAHTEIQNDSRNYKNKYEDGEKCLSFLTRTLQELFLKLQKPAEGIEKDALKDIFYVPSRVDAQQDVLPDDNSDDDINREDNPDIKNRSFSNISIQKLADGLRIVRNPNSTGIAGTIVEVKLGYRVNKGNPITKYDKLDFELDKAPITTTYNAAAIRTKHTNELHFEIQDDSFEVKLTGFDLNRDLVIKALEINS